MSNAVSAMKANQQRKTDINAIRTAIKHRDAEEVLYIAIQHIHKNPNMSVAEAIGKVTGHR